MNVVPGVTRSQVAGKDDADDTFFNRDLVTDFELGFVRTACHRSMWGWLLHQFHCDAQGEKEAFLPSEGSSVGAAEDLEAADLTRARAHLVTISNSIGPKAKSNAVPFGGFQRETAYSGVVRLHASTWRTQAVLGRSDERDSVKPSQCG
jgi:hypothetical protein